MNIRIPWNLQPKAFYPYTSVVLDRIFTVYYKPHDEISQLKDELVKLFQQEVSPRVQRDNKIVFEFVDENRKSVFFGFYDWVFAIGFACSGAQF